MRISSIDYNRLVDIIDELVEALDFISKTNKNHQYEAATRLEDIKTAYVEYFKNEPK